MSKTKLDPPAKREETPVVRYLQARRDQARGIITVGDHQEIHITKEEAADRPEKMKHREMKMLSLEKL